MAIFELQGPDGKIYEVDAPSMEAAASAFGGPAKQQQPAMTAPQQVQGSARAAVRGVPVLGALLDEVLASQRASMPKGGGAKDMFARQPVEGATFPERYGTALGQERATDAAFDKAHPVASPLLQIGGGLASGYGALKAAPQAAKFALGLGGKTAPAKIGLGALSGGVIGSAHGFAQGEGGLEERTRSAANAGLWGAGVGGAIPGVGAAAGRILGGGAPKAITADELGAAKKAAYTAAQAAGVTIKQGAWKTFSDNLTNAMTKGGVLHPDLHKGTASALKTIASETGDMTLERADLVRQVVNDAIDTASGPNGNGGDLARAMKVKETLDGFLDGLTPADTLSGDAAIAVPILKESRALAAREFKAKEMQKLVDLAGNQASTHYSAAGYEQALRVQFKNFNARLIKNPSEAKAFTKDELATIRKVAEGGPIGNALRWIGKWSPSGHLGTAISGGVGYSLGEALAPGMGVPGAVGVLGIGGAARQGATAMTSRNAANAVNLTRQGGPPPVNLSAKQISDMTRALLQGGNTAAGNQLPSLFPRRSRAFSQ